MVLTVLVPVVLVIVNLKFLYRGVKIRQFHWSCFTRKYRYSVIFSRIRSALIY
jgi:hypothetical protein